MSTLPTQIHNYVINERANIQAQYPDMQAKNAVLATARLYRTADLIEKLASISINVDFYDLNDNTKMLVDIFQQTEIKYLFPAVNDENILALAQLGFYNYDQFQEILKRIIENLRQQKHLSLWLRDRWDQFVEEQDLY